MLTGSKTLAYSNNNIHLISSCLCHATSVTHEKTLCVKDASVILLSTTTTLMTALHTVKTATEENDNGDGGEKKRKKWRVTKITWRTRPLSMLCLKRQRVQTENADRHGVAADCPDTPPETSCFLEVISDRMRLSRHHACGGQLKVSLSRVFLVCLWNDISQINWRVYDVWRYSQISDYVKEEATAGLCGGSVGPTDHAPSWRRRASQHQTTVHALTYGWRSTTNFHHLLQFQWERSKSSKVKSEGDTSFRASTLVSTKCIVLMAQ